MAPQHPAKAEGEGGGRSDLLLPALPLQAVLPLQRLHHDGLPPPLQVDGQQLQGLPVLLRLWAHLRRGALLRRGARLSGRTGAIRKDSSNTSA